MVLKRVIYRLAEPICCFFTRKCCFQTRLDPLDMIWAGGDSWGWAGIPVPVHSQEWKPPIPIPEIWEWIFHSVPFPEFRECFFYSLPVPELWECFFFLSLYVSELWEWIFSFPSHSRICYFTDGNQNGNWITVRDTRPPIFSASSTFLKTIILRR